MSDSMKALEVRTEVLRHLQIREEELGTATLTVEDSGQGYWAWDYADSMTHDWGTVFRLVHGGWTVLMDPDSASADEGFERWEPESF